MGALSVVLIGPHKERRLLLARAFAGPQANVTKELADYPVIDNLDQIVAVGHDVIVVDLDPDPERALDVVENVCGLSGSQTVMVYSDYCHPELLVRCMRAGAREFLSKPLEANTVVEALVRASARRDEGGRSKKAIGKLLVFVGAKGGSGVTTVASNFAVALAATQPGGKVALIDLDLQLGDAALTLGLSTKFSIVDALESADRLDSDFLSVLLAKHGSGLAVLPAMDKIPIQQPDRNEIEKLLQLVREDFAYVVADAGSHSVDMYEALFEAASTVYLVTQISVHELRNANRFISRYFTGNVGKKLEIVLNRHVSRNVEIDEAAITKALMQPVKWKVPNDFEASRWAQNTGTPVIAKDNQISRALNAMVAAAAGVATVSEKKRKFGLFR